MSVPLISYLTDIHFGTGAVRMLPDVLRNRSLKRPLLVTDEGILAAGLHERLPIDETVVFADVSPNPTVTNVQAAARRYRESGCDSIIALGGGSPIDCAKATSISITHDHPLEQYALIRGGMSLIRADKPDVIAIPTTSGTGSEVGRASLITFNATTKLAIVGKYVIPDVAICDPELTVGLPTHLTAATGMDAISHCIETYCSPRFNPVADAIALDGLRRACRYLRAVCLDGSDVTARAEMMMASTQGALAFQKGLGLIHSLSHPLGAIPKQLHHGTLNSVFLPHVLRFNHDSCPDRMQQIASAVGCDSHNDLASWFETLAGEIGIPQRLSDLGVTGEDLAPLAEAAFADHSTPTNPRMVTVSDCESVYRAAL